MKVDRIDPAAAPATLQDVIDRLGGGGLPETRKRDLRSAVVTFGKLMDRAPASIPLDLAGIRAALDAMVPAQAKVSRKRWANLRSDLAAAIEVAGLRPMLKTAGVALDEPWSSYCSGHRPTRAQWPVALCPLGEPAPDRSAGRRQRRHRALHCRTGRGDPDPQPRQPAPQRGDGLESARSSAARRGAAAVAVPTSRLAPTRVTWAQLPSSSAPTLSATLPGARCPIRSTKMRGQVLWRRGRCNCGAITSIPPSPPPAPPGSTSLLDVARKPGRARDLQGAVAAPVGGGRSHAHGLYSWRCRHAGRDRRGMGEAAGGKGRNAQGASPQTRDAAVRSDRQEQGAAAQVRRPAFVEALIELPGPAVAPGAPRPGDLTAAVHRPAERAGDRPAAARADADGESRCLELREASALAARPRQAGPPRLQCRRDKKRDPARVRDSDGAGRPPPGLSQRDCAGGHRQATRCGVRHLGRQAENASGASRLRSRKPC